MTLDDKTRYKLANRLALKHYWRITKRNKKYSIPGLLLPSLNNILVAYVPPLAIAAIVKLATKSNGTADFSEYLPYIALFTGSWILGEVVMRLGIHFAIKSQIAAVQQLYDDALSSLLRQDLSFFQENFAGSLTKKTIGFANMYNNIFNVMAMNIIHKLLPAGFAAVILWQFSPWLVLCLFTWLLFALVVMYPLIQRRVELVTLREVASNTVSGHIADIYGNIDAVRAHASEDLEKQRSQIFVKDLARKQRNSWNFQNLRVDTVVAPIYVATNTSGLLLSIYLASKGMLDPTSIIVTFTYFAMVTGFMWQFNEIYRQLETATTEAAQFTELLLEEPSVSEPDDPDLVKNPRGQIEFEHVDFAFPDNNKQLFHDFNLTIPAGQKVGLIGRSGGGKSSIIKLLLRFSDINNGAIKIDGVDIRDMPQRNLRNLIAYVPQDPAMFHRSIAENIAYGKPGLTHEEIVDAAKKAHAHEFIERLPNGYDTLVGERGTKLSGGQRQRVAIARAIVKDAPILLLDEATSALDSESESLIQDALQHLMERKTAIVIAHRLSTIQDMDRIIVMDRGQIKEDGTHKQLVKKKGIYSDLWKHQTGGFIED